MITPKDGLTSPLPDGERRDSAGAGPGARALDSIAGYTLEEVIGESEAATVYRATRDGRIRALKIYRRDSSPDPLVLGRLVEVALRHPNLAVVEEFGEEAGAVYVARSLLRGDSLDRVLATPGGDSPLASPGFPPRARDGRPGAGFYRHVVGLFAEIADGLQLAHEQGLVHGGIHPGNLIFSPSGRLVLTDFGENLASGSAELYMAPEQRAELDDARGVPVDAGTDVYSLAAVLLRVLAAPGDRAGAPDSIAEMRPEGHPALSSDLRAVLCRALAAEKERRYASAAESAADLRRLLGLESPLAAEDPGNGKAPAGEAAGGAGGGQREIPDRDEREHGSVEHEHGLADDREDDNRGTDNREDDSREDDSREDRDRSLDPESERGSPRVDRPRQDESDTEAAIEYVSPPRSPESKPSGAVVGPAPDRPIGTTTASPPRDEMSRAPFLADRGGVDPALASHSLISRAKASPLRSRQPLGKAGARGREHAGQGAAGEERRLLFDALDPAAVPRSGRETRSRRRLVLAFSTVLILVVTAATLLSLHLHDIGSHYRSNALRLGRGARRLVHAALTLEDGSSPLGAANALATARASLSSVSPPLEDLPLRELSDLEARLRSASRDPNLARLRSGDGLVKAAAIDAIRRELASGERSPADLDVVAEYVQGEDPEVALRAIRACAEGKRQDLLAARFPLGRDRETIRLPAEVFRELYDSWGEGALDGNDAARERFFALSFDALCRLDAAIAGGSAAGRLSVPPNLLIHGLDSLESGDFVRRWLRVASRLDGASVLRQLPRLQRRGDLAGEIVAALERMGTPEAVRALRRLTLSRIQRRGAEGIDALARLGEAGVLADMAYEPIPLESRSYAVRRALALDSESGHARIAALIRLHPEPAIRRAAVEALARPAFVARHPEAAVAALCDPYLRDASVELLGDDLPPAVVDALLEVLRTSEQDLRIRVVRILGRSRDPSALIPLARQLRESSPRLRRETLDALAALGDDRAIPLATGLLEPGHEGLRELARTLLEENAADLKEDRGLLVLALVELLQLETSDSESYGLKDIRRNLLLGRLGVAQELFDRALPPRLREALGLPPS